MPRIIDIPLGWTYPNRIEHLRNLAINQNPQYSYKFKFQDKPTTLPVYTVEIAFPKYRLANGRTQAAQEEYIAKNNLPSDFFSRDLESLDAQRIQHQLLVKIGHKTMFDYFTDPSNTQDQPLILSSEGFVVNGNRRLSILREIYYSDQVTYSRYSHVDIVVLPTCSEKDIDELEAYLQLQPDIKEDYSWITFACMLRARQTKYSYTNEVLANRYGKSVKLIQTILSELNLVDEYLHSRGIDKQYECVEQDEYAFKEFLKSKQKIKDPEQKEIFTKINHLLIDNSDTAEGRLYDRIPEVQKHLNPIISRLQSVIGVSPDTEISGTGTNVDIFGVIQSNPTHQPIINLLSKEENRDTVLNNVLDVVDGERVQERQRTRANAVLNNLADANAKLKTAINMINETTSKQGIPAQLIEIEKSIDSLRNWLEENA